MRGRSVILAGLLLLPAMLIISLLFAGAGCGSKADPEKILREALNKSSEASSLQADILVESASEEGSRSLPFVVEGTAAVDMAERAASISFQVMGFEAELRHVDEEDYLMLGSQWYTFSGGAGDSLFAGLGQGVSEAAFFHPQLLGQYTRVETQGEEKVGGRECYRFVVTLDPRALAELEPVKRIGELFNLDPSDLASELESMAPQVEVWVEKDQGYIRKITVSAGVDASGGILGIDLLRGRMRLKATAVFNAYDVPLEIEAPTSTIPFDPALLPL